jgi:DNA-binding transcriptional LysR family regulator
LVELKQLRYIVVLAEELNFSKAAKRLFISQPPLSRQIRSAEEQLGLKLFERTKRHVSLTEGGKVLVEQARLILSESERVVDLAVMASRGETGVLRIGVIGTSDRIIPNSISIFARRYPHVHIAVSSIGPVSLVEQVQNGAIDCALLRSPIEVPELDIVELYPEPLAAALGQGHPLVKRKHLSLSVLANETLLLIPRHRSPVYHDIIISLFNKAGLAPKVIRESESATSLATLVAANQGIAIIGSRAQEFQRRDIVLVGISSPAAVVSFSVIYKQSNKSKPLHRFLEILQRLADKKLGRS